MLAPVPYSQSCGVSINCVTALDLPLTLADFTVVLSPSDRDDSTGIRVQWPLVESTLQSHNGLGWQILQLIVLDVE